MASPCIQQPFFNPAEKQLSHSQTSPEFTKETKKMSSSPKQKSPKKLPNKLSFTNALKNKYCDDDASRTSGNDFVIVRMSGRPRRTSEHEAELEHLHNVILSGQNIDSAGIPTGGLKQLCPNLCDLDLSANLLENWSEVLLLASELPHLSFLNLAENSLHRKEALASWQTAFPKLQNLVLNRTQTNWDDMSLLSRFLPALRELHLCGNGFTKVNSTGLGCLSRLECLRLNGNRLSSWEEIWKLHELPKLKTLVLSENPLSEIYYYSCSQPEQAADRGTPQTTGSGPQPTGGADSAETATLESSQPTEAGDAETSTVLATTEACLKEESQSTFEVCSEMVQISLDPNHQLTFSAEDSNAQLHSDPKNVGVTAVLGENCSDREQTSEQQGQLNDIETCESLVESSEQAEYHSESALQSETIDNSRTCLNSSKTSMECSDEKGNEQNACEITYDQSEVGATTEETNCGCGGRPFPALSTLCLTETKISSWNEVPRLNQFPVLNSVRLMKIPLGSSLDPDERRKLMVASLPKMSKINGSEVTYDERDKSERHYVRYFQQQQEQPDHFSLLSEKHVDVKPLVDIDIGFGYQEWVNVVMKHKGSQQQMRLHSKDTVATLRKQLSKTVNLAPNGMRLFLLRNTRDLSDPTSGEMEELVCSSFSISRYNLHDGDEIHVDQETAHRAMNPWETTYPRKFQTLPSGFKKTYD